MKFALSTMWWEQDGASFATLAQRTRALGFAHVELGYRLTEEALPAVDAALAKSGLAVSSIHAPFPGPPGPSPLRQADLSSPDPEVRRRAEALVNRSLREAATRGARVVVVHAGNIEALYATEKELDRLFEAGCHNSPEYTRLREELWRQREALAPQYLERLYDALSRLCAEAQALGVSIALENRAHFRDLPSLPEMGKLLETFAPAVGYWHDAGHAYRLEAMGFWPQEGWLRAYGGYLLGTHLHDCVGLNDHRPPGDGNIPFRQLAPLFPVDAWRVVEVDAAYGEGALASGVAYLRSVGVL